MRSDPNTESQRHSVIMDALPRALNPAASPCLRWTFKRKWLSSFCVHIYAPTIYNNPFHFGDKLKKGKPSAF